MAQDNQQEGAEMSDREKLDKILDLLTDKTVGKLIQQRQLEPDETCAGLTLIGYCFRKAYQIAQQS